MMKSKSISDWLHFALTTKTNNIFPEETATHKTRAHQKIYNQTGYQTFLSCHASLGFPHGIIVITKGIRV